MVMMTQPPIYKIDYFIDQIPSAQLWKCLRKCTCSVEGEAHTSICSAILHWCPTAQRCPTMVTSFRCCIWWKWGCIATATTLNCTRRAMDVEFSIATIWLIAMTHASFFGRPVSQKEGNVINMISKTSLLYLSHSIIKVLALIENICSYKKLNKNQPTEIWAQGYFPKISLQFLTGKFPGKLWVLTLPSDGEKETS